MKTWKPLLLFSIICFGLIARFYNLNWGAPYYFHPDERNIASSASGLSFPNQMNPHFFAYGSLPIYTTYGIGVIKNLIVSKTFSPVVSFENAIVISRAISAFLSVVILYLVFLVGKKIKDRKTGLILAALTGVNTGLIQYAHFGTFEIWITFLSLGLFYLCLRLLKKTNIQLITFMSINAGALIATKISTIPLLGIPLLVLFFLYKKKKISLYKTLTLQGIFIVVTFLTLAITSPFLFLDYTAFINSIQYESSVALGTLPVFYTQSFYGTTPVIFQLTHIFPFILNPLVALMFVLLFPYFLYAIAKKQEPINMLLLLFFILLFFSQVFLFAKWTRYMIPTIPFVLLIIVCSLEDMKGRFTQLSLIVLIIISFFYSILFIKNVHMQKDTRVVASEKSSKLIPSTSPIVSEVFDLGIVPFNQFFNSIELLNIYEIEHDIFLREQVFASLNKSEYVIIPSERILNARIKNPEKFPKGYGLYSGLLNGTLGFEKIYQTECPLDCQLLYNFGYVEDTTYIFDRPNVYVFKKNE